MWWLIAGVAVWSVVHLSIGFGPRLRASLVDRLGENPYKGIFSLLIVGSLVMIVLGWRNSVPYPVYDAPSWGRGLSLLLMGPAFILFLSSNLPNNIRRLLRHPQLTGIALWSVAHLLANGDRRSIVLFAGLAIWAVAEMLAINRREGPWTRPAPVPLNRDLLTVAAGMAVFGLLAWLHPYYTGMPVLIR